MDIKMFRQEHPEYNDMSDDDLTSSLHRRFYSDMDLGDFKSRFMGEKKGPETSATGAFLRGAGQGLFGLGDELTAAAKASFSGKDFKEDYGYGASDAVTGQDQTEPSWGQRYDAALAEERRLLDKSSEEHPVAYYGGDIGSSVLMPAGLARIGIRGAQVAGRTLPGAMRAAAGEAAIYGGLHGAGRSEGGAQQRAEGAAGGAAGGALLGGAVQGVAGALAPTGRALMDRVHQVVDPEGAAARSVLNAQAQARAAQEARGGAGAYRDRHIRRIQRELADDGAVLPPMAMIDEGRPLADLGRTAANSSPEARAVLQDFTGDRFEGQAGRFGQFLTQRYGPQNNIESALARRADASRANRPMYDRAMEEGDRALHSPVLERLVQTKVGTDAARKAATNVNDRAATEGFGRMNPPIRITEDGQVIFQRGGITGPPAYPNLRFWDQIKRELDDQVTSLRGKGEFGQADTVRRIRDGMRDELDRLVPSYGEARGSAARFFRANDAAEAGENFARNLTSFPLEQASVQVRNMHPAERRVFRDAFMGELQDQVGRSPDRADIVKRFFNTPDKRARASLALGSRRAQEIEAYLRMEGLQMVAKNAVQGNSTTARQLMDLGVAGAGGLVAGGGDYTDPKTMLVAGLLYGGRVGGRNITRGRMEQWANETARLLMTGTQDAVNEAAARIAAQPGFMEALRNATGNLSMRAGSGAVSGSYAAQEGN